MTSILENADQVIGGEDSDRYNLTILRTEAQPEVTGTRDTFAFHLTRESTGSGVQSAHKAHSRKERKVENSIDMRQPR